MILPSSTIVFNYELAMKQANALDTIADSQGSLGKLDLANALNRVSSNWEGESASRFRKKGEQLQSSITTTSRNLHEIAEEIRTVARRMRDMEMANVAIAKTD